MVEGRQAEMGAGSARAARRAWAAWAVGLLAVALMAAGGWLVWRYTAPVRVSFVAEIGNLPFTVEAIPAVVAARPGEVVSMTYRIRNNNVTPVSAFGRLEFVPASAEQQMTVYLTQCGGLNTYQNSYTDDYDVVFRVRPAGLWGTSHIEVRHTFTRASPP